MNIKMNIYINIQMNEWRKSAQDYLGGPYLGERLKEVDAH